MLREKEKKAAEAARPTTSDVGGVVSPRVVATKKAQTRKLTNKEQRELDGLPARIEAFRNRGQL